MLPAWAGTENRAAANTQMSSLFQLTRGSPFLQACLGDQDGLDRDLDPDHATLMTAPGKARQAPRGRTVERVGYRLRAAFGPARSRVYVGYFAGAPPGEMLSARSLMAAWLCSMPVFTVAPASVHFFIRSPAPPIPCGVRLLPR